MKKLFLASVMAGALVLPLESSLADGYDIGIRSGVVLASGEPANDILTSGIFGRIPLGNNRFVGIGLNFSLYDFEEPAKLVGLRQAGEKAIDADATSNILEAWYEQRYDTVGGKWQWLWTAGAGINDLSVDPVSGDLANGGRFDIVSDAGTELLLTGGIGAIRNFGNDWAFETDLKVEHHFADWTVTDNVSGTTASVDDYTGVSLMLGIVKSF